MYAIVSGLQLYLEKGKDSVIPRMYFNGCPRLHYVCNDLLFAAGYVVTGCAINVPGCMHESQIRDGLYDKVERHLQ